MEVRRITYQDTKPFILGIHYARRMPSISFAFGLFNNDQLVGVCTFGQPASPSLCKGIAGIENKKNVLELNRLVFSEGNNKKNNASFLVSRSLKQLPNYTFVVSYADWGGWHHVGYVYQATNWYFSGTTKPRTDKYSDGHSRHYAKDEKRRQPRTAKHRYIYLVGDRREKKKMLKELNYKISFDYPKGDSVHYDISNPIPLVNKTDLLGGGANG